MARLHLDVFVQRQAMPGNLRVPRFLREMEQPHGLRARWRRHPGALHGHPLPGHSQLRARFGHGRLEFLQRAPNQRPQPALRQPFRQWINGRDAVEMYRAFQLLDDLGLRMVNRARPQRDGLSEHDDFVPRLEILFHEGQVPPPAMQSARPVVHDHFKYRLAAAAKSPQARGDDLAASQGRLVQLQLRDALEMAAVLVAAGAVQQQLAHRAQFQPLQLGGALRPDARPVGPAEPATGLAASAQHGYRPGHFNL